MAVISQSHYYISTGKDYDVEAAAQYMKLLYLSSIPHHGRIVYPHFTTATDTSNVTVVFQAVMDTIIYGNLRHAQLW
jgi:guanine nucleotide-binding protein subunit alpha